MDKFLTKENIIIAVAVFSMIIQSNYFATKLDLANMKLEMAAIKSELQIYSDNGDKELMQSLDRTYKEILQKLDTMKKNGY